MNLNKNEKIGLAVLGCCVLCTGYSLYSMDQIKKEVNKELTYEEIRGETMSLYESPVKVKEFNKIESIEMLLDANEGDFKSEVEIPVLFSSNENKYVAQLPSDVEKLQVDNINNTASFTYKGHSYVMFLTDTMIGDGNYSINTETGNQETETVAEDTTNETFTEDKTTEQDIEQIKEVDIDVPPTSIPVETVIPSVVPEAKDSLETETSNSFVHKLENDEFNSYYLNLNDKQSLCITEKLEKENDEYKEEFAGNLLESVQLFDGEYKVVLEKEFSFDGKLINAFDMSAIQLNNGTVISTDAYKYKESIYDKDVKNSSDIEFKYKDKKIDEYLSYVKNIENTVIRITADDVTKLDNFHIIELEEITELEK